MERINRWLSDPIYSRFTIILVIINLGAYIIIYQSVIIFIVNMGVLILNVLLINHSVRKSDIVKRVSGSIVDKVQEILTSTSTLVEARNAVEKILPDICKVWDESNKLIKKKEEKTNG